ncbi:MAG: ABC transporter permease, partial [Rhodospirillales bacterium]|nr:ABC transporter permease [Rhodospirillales bacterium]
IEISCENHEGPGKVALQRWDAKAKKWNVVSDFYEPLRDVLDPLIKEDSEAYAAENNITPRDCP